MQGLQRQVVDVVSHGAIANSYDLLGRSAGGLKWADGIMQIPFACAIPRAQAVAGMDAPRSG